MGHDETVYPNAGSFQPERWITKDRLIQTYDQYKFPVFQAGPRICLGKDLALYEVKVLLVEVLRCFRFEFPEANAPKDWSNFRKDVPTFKGNPVYTPGLTISFNGDLMLDIYKR